MRRARVALAAAAAGLLIWPGVVALRAMPVDAEVPTMSPPGAAATSSTVAADASDDPVSGPVDDLRARGVRTAAGGVAAAPQSATVRAAIGPVQRPPATAPTARHVEPASGVQAVLAAAYERAARSVPGSCHLQPAYLAAIGQIESGSLGGRQLVGHRVLPTILGPLLDGGPFAVVHDTDGGRYDGSAQYDRAVGPMQFLPGTWAWAGRDGDGDGVRDPQNVFDASYAAAAYLCRGGRNLSREAALRDAFWSYNQSTDYVSAALAWVSYFERNGLGALDAVDIRVASGGRASDLGAAPRAAVTATAGPLTPAIAPGTATSAVAGATEPVPTPVTTSPPVTTTTAPTTTTSPTTAPTTAAPTTTATDSPTATTATTTSPATSTGSTAAVTTTTTDAPTTPVQTP